MARKTHRQRAAAELRRKKKQQASHSAYVKRKARNKNVDRSVKVEVHDLTCEIFDRKDCSCGLS